MTKRIDDDEEVFTCSQCKEEFLVRDREYYKDDELCPNCYSYFVECKGSDHKYYGVSERDFL